MAFTKSPNQASSFRGLNNVTDPLRLGLRWLVQADNVDITDTGAIEKRAGYSKTFTGALSDAYATLDFERLYVVDGGVLSAMAGPAAATPLVTGLSAAPMHFTEVNEQVFFNNGTDSGIVCPDGTVLEWRWDTPDAPSVAAVTGDIPAGLYQVRCTYVLPDGRETGASESAEIVLTDGQALQITGIPQRTGCTTRVYIAPADSTVFQLARSGSAGFVWNSSPDTLGVDLWNHQMHQLPLGADVVQAWKGRMYAAQYFPQDNQTAIWFSQPMGFHLFDLGQDFILVTGRVLMLAPTPDALVIGTDSQIHAYNGEAIVRLAPYGVVPGAHWDQDAGRTLFWTTRGLCAALPFVNLTERQVSVSPGTHAGGALVQQGGRKRYLVALRQGGAAFNPHL